MAIVAVLALAAAGCGKTESKEPVARVGSVTITRADLERTVEHFREEAQKEGKPFPDEGTAGFRTVERQLVGLLAYRAQLQLAARRIGVEVTGEQVEARMGHAEEGESGEEEGEFARETVRAQLLYEAVFAKVTAGVPTVRRLAVMKRWLAAMKRRYPPRYLLGAGSED